MIHPTTGELLDGAVRIVEESLLPELEGEFVRGKAAALIALLRRAALLADRFGSACYEDNHDIERTLRAVLVSAAGRSAAWRALCDRIAHALPAAPAEAGGFPAPAALAERNRSLRAALVAAVEGLHALSDDREQAQRALGSLQELMLRSAERETELLPARG